MQEKEKHIALTKSQLSLWVGQKLNPNVPLYNMVHTFDMKGAINVQHFSKAFSKLVNSVEILRMVFAEVDNIPHQFALKDFEFDFEIIDFSAKEELDIQEWIKKRSQVSFDFSKPLFDSSLIKIGDERYIWFLNMHHLITDAATSTIIYNLQTKLYADISNGSFDTDLKIPSYQDYVNFEKEQIDGNLSETIGKYWKEKTESFSKVSEFYGRKSNASTSTAKRVKLNLGSERTQKLKELANDPKIRSWTQDLTLFNIFTTSLFIFMNRVSGQKNLTIGAPSHNRPTNNFKQTPGLFIEIFPLFTEFEADDSFASVLNRVKLETNNYMRYAQPGMITPEISRSFNVVLNYINASFDDFNGIPMSSEWIHPDHCDPNHQLRCHIQDMDASGDIEIHFDLNTDVFHEELRNEIPRHFLKILDGLLDDINQSIYKPSLVEELEEKPVNRNHNFSSVIEHFEKQAIENANAIALRYKEKSFSYKELNEKANQFANWLTQKGIAKNQKIALYLERSPDYIITVLAALKAGACFIPIASDQPEQRVDYILKDATAAMVITNTRLVANITTAETDVVNLDTELSSIENQSIKFETEEVTEKDLLYMIYTSGTTGNPKGVLLSNKAVYNYLDWAKNHYSSEEKFIFPLFTSIGFDLTITATFLPLITGGELVVYKESNIGPDISLMEVLEDNLVNSIKLTPSHLALIQGNDNSASHIKTMIVGGEDFKTKIAAAVQQSFGTHLRIYNEYGPTEATVGCIVSQFNAQNHTNTSVPIGLPIAGSQAIILDDFMNQVPKGVIGSLYISGNGLADGYLNLPELTSSKLIENPFNSSEKLYYTGDLARINSENEFEYLGRIDEQVKLGGFRIELTDIESNLLKHHSVENTAVVVIENEKSIPENEVINCSKCGLPSNYPNTDFDEQGVCHVCTAFAGYKDQAQRYFKTEDELRDILMSKRGESPNYDCISLLSGGKDSTYILAQLINMGLKVLAFTLDNGYISDQAKGNIDRIVSKLNVDHIYGTTEYMNKIFVDSLHRHQNVCNGCFKTIYTLSTKIALAKQIPFIVTGLSRGQFFETRLTEELFWDKNVDVATIDDTILEARKLYHQEEDAIKELMDVSAFNNSDTFDKVQFVDFYRYSDVSLEEMLVYLKEKVDWIRPTDTGRSTNCTINQLGIYVHKKEKGYSNYSFPYSWDVRMGHKTRTETLEEINEVIDVKEVKRIMTEIGYAETSESQLEQKRLVGYYTGKEKISSKNLANHLKKELPDYMIPSYFKYIDELPLTSNGKIDKSALKALNTSQLDMDTPFVSPDGEIEELVASIWREVLRLKQVGVHDDFIALGGHSLAAIRVTARINEEIEMKFPLNKIFEQPTISSYSKYIEETLTSLLEE